MTTESIDVYFEPIGTVGGLIYYHETLVYIDSNGVQYLATAYASDTSPQGNKISNLGQAASAAESGGSSNFGTIVTEGSPLSSLFSAEIEHWMGSSTNP